MNKDALTPLHTDADPQANSDPEQNWNDNTELLVQNFYLEMLSQNAVVQAEDVSVEMPSGNSIIVGQAEVAAYDNGHMRYMLRVKMDDEVYRVFWGGHNMPPDVKKKESESEYSTATDDEAHIARQLVLTSADFLLQKPN